MRPAYSERCTRLTSRIKWDDNAHTDTDTHEDTSAVPPCDTHTRAQLLSAFAQASFRRSVLLQSLRPGTVEQRHHHRLREKGLFQCSSVLVDLQGLRSREGTRPQRGVPSVGGIGRKVTISLTKYTFFVIVWSAFPSGYSTAAMLSSSHVSGAVFICQVLSVDARSRCSLYVFNFRRVMCVLARTASFLPAVPSVEQGDVKPASTRPSSGLVQMSGNAWKLRSKGFQGRLNAPMLRTWRQVCCLLRTIRLKGLVFCLVFVSLSSQVRS